MRFTEDDLTRWISANRLRFLDNPEHYTPDHVSELAILVGFPAKMVFERFASFGEALVLIPETFGPGKRTRCTISQVFLSDLPPPFTSWEELGEKLIMGLENRE